MMTNRTLLVVICLLLLSSSSSFYHPTSAFVPPSSHVTHPSSSVSLPLTIGAVISTTFSTSPSAAKSNGDYDTPSPSSTSGRKRRAMAALVRGVFGIQNPRTTSSTTTTPTTQRRRTKLRRRAITLAATLSLTVSLNLQHLNLGIQPANAHPILESTQNGFGIQSTGGNSIRPGMTREDVDVIGTLSEETEDIVVMGGGYGHAILTGRNRTNGKETNNRPRRRLMERC